jgi:3-deoxy-D-manno-octulosonic-acid transferase
MPVVDRAYSLSVRTLRRIAPFFEQGGSKLSAGLRGRVRARAILEDWASIYRDRERPLVWMHAPSVGEGLQARAVLEVLLAQRPDLQAAYTFFSPSAVDLARRMPVHVAGFLPWDIRTEMEELLGSLAGGLLVFTKTEVWPGLAAAAVARGIPVVLAAATLPEGAGRLSLAGRVVLGPTFRSLTNVLAVSPEDGERFRRLGVSESRIAVTGDPGVDSAWQRARDVNPRALYLAPFLEDRRPTLVAGSTWAADEAVLVPALVEAAGRVDKLRVVIAPHEPHEADVGRLVAILKDAGFRTARLGDVEARGRVGDADAVVVDRVGVLAHLYTVGDVAYVGGGFGKAGLHSVLEPAAAGKPILFGPRQRNSHAAAELLRIGAAERANDATDVARVLVSWLRDRRRLEEAAGRASGYIEAHRGAARRTADALAGLLPAQKEQRVDRIAAPR